MRSTHRLPLLLSAGIAGLLIAALPFGFDPSTLSPVAAQAWAGSENGHGNGHGDGNGNGNGNANGHAKDNSGDSDASDGSASTGSGADDGSDDGDDDASASELGALNAAHASPQALAHAS